jgi:VWFA-related protein
VRWQAAVVIFATVLLPGVGLAQPATPPASLTTVRIDAIATDHRGRAITTLKAADFQLKVDGRPHPVDTVTLEQTRRVIGILLDTYHLPPGAVTDRARAAMTAFVERDLRPDDIVFIIEPLAQLTTLQPIADRAQMRQKIQALAGREGDYAPRTDFERKYLGRVPAAVESARARIVYSALEALTTALGTKPGGRKSLLFVTTGDPDQPSAASLHRLDGVLRAANRFDVAIYPIDPSSSQTSAATRLDSLAERSGGRLVSGPDLDAGLAQVGRDADAFYRLTFDAPEADGRFHDVHVAVKRRGVQVWSRTGYWVPSRADIDLIRATTKLRELPPPPAISIRPAHTSGLIRSWFGLLPGSNGETRVTFTWEPDASAPVSRRDGGAARVLLSATTLDGKSIFEGPVAPASADAAGKQRQQAVFDAPPGTLELQMKISAADGKALDADVRHLAIPKLDASRTLLATPELFRSRTALEYRTIVDRADAAPTASHEFSRAERLIVRVRAYAPVGSPIVSARLLNLSGDPIQTLSPLASAPDKNTTQFAVTLAAFPPGDYTLELKATSEAGEVGTLVPFRVVN